MSDDKNQQGNQDRLRVSGNEDYEVQYLADKFKVDAAIVRKTIAEVGNMGNDVEEFLTTYKNLPAMRKVK